MGRPNLTEHRKFRRLARELDSDVIARGCLELLWDSAYQNGDPYLGEKDDVELAARWKGDHGKLTHALLLAGGDGHAGFIEELPDKPGHYREHDLFDHAPDYVQKRKERELERKKRGVTLSEDRRDAALKSHESHRRRNAGNDASGLQLSANDGHMRTLAVQTSANGATPAPAPAPTPAPTPTDKENPLSEKAYGKSSAKTMSNQEQLAGTGNMEQGTGFAVPELKKDRSELIELIARTYPGNKTLDGLMVPHIMEKAIGDAIDAHGDKVLAGTKAYAAAVAKFPPHKRQFIPAAEKWFMGGKYNTDPAEWVEVKPGEDAPIIFKSAAPRDCAKEALADLAEGDMTIEEAAKLMRSRNL